MSQINVDNIKNRTGGAIGAPSGIVVTGVSTFNGNVSVGGTLTYEDVTNIDSVGLITARKGIIATGVVTATSFSGSGANLTGVESGVSDFVASGDIPNGATVVINTDGTVGIVTRTASTDPDNPDVGTPVVFNSGTTQSMSSIYDSNSNKVVIAYRDGGNNNYGTAVIGTVTPTTNSISFGTPVVFNSSGRSDLGNGSVAYDSSNNKVVIAYKDHGNSNYGTAVVGTVSGTSISFGTPVVFESAATNYPSATFDSTNNKVVIAYEDDANSDYGTAVVGTVSGTSISFGTPVVFESFSTSYHSIAYIGSGKVVISYRNSSDSKSYAIVGTVSGTSISFGGARTQFTNLSLYIKTTYVGNSKVVIAYRDTNSVSEGAAKVGTISGSSISFGSAVVFEPDLFSYSSAAYDSTNDKLVIAYQDGGNSNYGTAIVGTVSGTSISFGTHVVFESASVVNISAAYDSNSGKVVIAYTDYGNSQYGTAIVGTVSGTSISFGTPVVYESNQTEYISAVYDSTNEKVVIAYQDGAGVNNGTAVVFQNASTNLTSLNYTGIAAEAIADGATGKVTILGGVNTGQTGLTTSRTHYIQNDGSLATSAGSPSVVAGTAISASKLLVWKS